uniref:Rhamnogalacturonase A/B/Epimerase-like pectate lyase domain-containing protein n=1 Tax=Arcella intermedia TaxID=1963864 RepID=A0A6B2L5B9_9EUKA
MYPTDFGADPTGKTDSTTAFSAVVKALLAKDTGHKLADGITDLGGATVDLGGGDYLISQPIVIPVYYGNFHFKSGTLRASSAFPKDRFLIEIGSKSCSNGQGSCNENVGFEDMMLDSQLIAAGGLHIIATMGANVGPQMFFLGFQNAGIRVSGGHETMIHETWLGQYLYSDPRSSNPTANGIELLGNDHYITNTIVFSSRVGVLITGAANLLTGVHTWNLASSEGGIGIYVDAPGYTQNRLVACYLDFNSVVAVAPEHLSIVDGFFLCGGNIVLVAIPGHQTVNGLNVIDNQWDQCSNNTIMLDQTQAKFTDVIDTTIESNMANPTSLLMKSTKATAKLRLENASKWQFDFNNRLLFGSIQNFGYSMVIEGNGFARHAARAINGNIVTVETDQPVTGTVYVWVDQSRDSQPCGSTCK